MPAAPRQAIPVRIYRLLLALLLPPRFRQAYAEQMALVFADLHTSSVRVLAHRSHVVPLIGGRVQGPRHPSRVPRGHFGPFRAAVEPV